MQLDMLQQQALSLQQMQQTPIMQTLHQKQSMQCENSKHSLFV
jgi:hypothetical protein